MRNILIKANSRETGVESDKCSAHEPVAREMVGLRSLRELGPPYVSTRSSCCDKALGHDLRSHDQQQFFPALLGLIGHAAEHHGLTAAQ